MRSFFSFLISDTKIRDSVPPIGEFKYRNQTTSVTKHCVYLVYLCKNMVTREDSMTDSLSKNIPSV